MKIHCPQLSGGKKQGSGGGGQAQPQAGTPVGSQGGAGADGVATGRVGQSKKQKPALPPCSRFQQAKREAKTITNRVQTATQQGLL